MTPAEESLSLPSIGALLAYEREKRGIPVEKAAKETRMRPQRIRDMESDDLSNFTNPSYARMFIIAYAKYLAIPMKTISEHLPDRGEPCTEGYQYISTPTHDLPSLRHNIAGKPTRRSPAALYVLTIATLLVILAGAIGIITYLGINLSRLSSDQNRSEKEDVAEATPTPAPVYVPVPIVTYFAENIPPEGAAESFQPEAMTPVAPATVSLPFTETAEMAAPPTPEPGVVNVRKPSPALSVTMVPAPAEEQPIETAVPDDRAFLLGSPPDLKPVNVQ
jgi:cytoskeletal protein RodZ